MVSAIGYADPMSTHEDTEPITTTEALNIVETMHRAAAIVARQSRYDYCQDADAVEGGELGRAKRFRLSARLVDTIYDPDGVAAVLRRRADVLDPGYAADRIDPPTAPAEPDLTTPEGWIAEATEARLVTSEMHAPNCDAERVALHDAWLWADEDSQIAACLARHFMLCVKL